MKYTIYKTTNIINNKIYIGKHQTLDPNDQYLGSGFLLSKAITKYGRENFVKEVLHVFDTEEEMNAKEKELVTEEFLSRDDVYNLCPGGQGGFGYLNSNGINHKNSAFKNKEWQRIFQEKAKNTRKLNSANAEYRQAISDKVSNGLKSYYAAGGIGSFSGKTHSENTKNKMKETHKSNKHSQGSKNSQYGSMWITNGIENRKIKKTDNIPEGWYKGRKIS